MISTGRKFIRDGIDHEITSWINSLTAAQMSKIYDVIDGPLPAEIKAMSDDDLLKELAA